MKPETRGRVQYSHALIARWETTGGPGGKLRTTMLMIRDELATLERIAEAHPEAQQEIADLSRRYGMFANRLKLGSA